MDGEWVDAPKAVIGWDNVEYKLYRHPHLYTNARVERFVAELWYRKNTETPKQYSDLSHWENQASKIYQRAFEAAKAQRRDNG